MEITNETTDLCLPLTLAVKSIKNQIFLEIGPDDQKNDKFLF